MAEYTESYALVQQMSLLYSGFQASRMHQGKLLNDSDQERGKDK